MAKGLCSQGVCLLTDGRTTLSDIKSALQQKDFEIVKESPPQKEWCFGGPSLTISFLPDVNGFAIVDVVNELWPDSMGDPKSDPIIFGAWSMGHFGPLAYPGGLARAGQHAWTWAPGRNIAEKHHGFIRIRMSYALGAKGDDPVFPKNYDSLAELNFITRAVLAMLDVHGVISYFNPNGEVLLDRAVFSEVWTACQKQKNIPLPLWTNIRFYNFSGRLGFMDTVGNGQLDLHDIEAIFPISKFEPADVGYYLRYITQYLLELDRPLKTGEDIYGPGETDLSWTIQMLEQGTVAPPRQVVRLFPKANREEVQQALAAR